ncbi:hypothetical protein QYE77_09640 [Thermanaerothrix sp. 4228-RoL]|uniref:Uncharacterized protein n=1 Tax=Thermanaerothrix solaris TaxID=3058434 RepID=A0ABU3NNU8_9CHLR|nr:hypothetical protein [Thermanaerothrix sp. 4228-RoL]MDT8898530.1 hypothetical protein [Thermanaerothrix sp. 4228-RoL]
MVRRNLTAWLSHSITFPLILFLLLVLAYGLFLPWLGFYWDDLPMLWIGKTYGAEGLKAYFATKRPFWGLLYQISMTFLGTAPWQWQLYAFFWRWLAGVMLWLTLRQARPQQPTEAAWIALAFSLYPGFGQQPISIVYSHFFIVLTAFFGSLYASLRAIRTPAHRWYWHSLGLMLSAINLLSMEYFFLLDLLRPLLLIQALTSTGAQRWRHALRHSLPYLILFVGIGLWRAFFFPYQTYNYQPHILTALAAQPLTAIGHVLTRILNDSLRAGLWVWFYPLQRLTMLPTAGPRTLIFTLVALAAALSLLFFMGRRTWRLTPPSGFSQRSQAARPWLGLGSAGLLLAGWPFWLTDLPVHFGFPYDRFTLPFMLGAACLLVGLVRLLPASLPTAFLVVALGLATAAQTQNSGDCRRDWEVQRALFWQMAWRIPALKPGTTIVMQGLPLRYYSDNSLTAPLNWIYAPENPTSRMDYLLVDLDVRRSHWALQSGIAHQPVQVDYLAAMFTGSTDQVLVLYYQPPACLRVVDPVLEADNLFLPPRLRHVAARLSAPNQIEIATPAPRLPAFYAPEPPHGWCYYYEQADLARQRRDWETVVALAETAFALGDYPNDPAERLPFIEGYAHTGQWEAALTQSLEAARVAPTMHGVVCRLWERLLRETPTSPQREQAHEALRQEIPCP